jgi:hypothetical protein
MPESDQTHSGERHTYLLSLWREGRIWRAALRPSDGGPRLGFGDLDQLVAFLLRLQDGDSLAVPAGPPRSGGSDEHRDR